MSESLHADAFFHPFGFALFAAWWIATLFCVAICQRHPNIPVRQRPWCNLLVLLNGPWGLAVLLMRYRYPAQESAAREYRDSIEGGPVTRWFRRVFRLDVEEEPLADTALELCTSDGMPVGQLDPRLGGRRGVEGEGMLRAKNLMQESIDNRASDLLIDPRPDQLYSVRARIDGVLHELDQLSEALAVIVLNCFKIAAKMDIAERRRPQDGSFMVKSAEVSFNCRISTTGTVRGPKAAIRLLDPRIGLRPVTDLGMRQPDLDRMLMQLNKKSGMILVCGPTGSGKTTTLYALLNQFDPQSRNLVTIEDPIEYPLEHATQTEVNEKASITFATTLRSMLRQNPDVILVGEVRDTTTAELAIQASNTGHLVLTTVHGNDSSAAIMRLRDLGIPTRRLSGAVSAVLSQRLVRVLCEHCKQAAQLSEEEWAMGRNHGLESRHVFTPSGCERCHYTGFYGRRGISELLFVNRDVDDCLSADPSLRELRDAAIAAGMQPMYDHGMELVGEGVTTFDEVNRVCQEG